MAAAFNGKWKNTKDENFGDYLKALGVGTVKRAVIEKVHPDVDISVDGEVWTVKVISTFTNQENVFTIGTKFESDYKGVTSGKMSCMPSFDGSKLTVDATPIDADIAPTTTIREILGDGSMVQTMVCNGVTAKRFYTKK